MAARKFQPKLIAAGVAILLGSLYGASWALGAHSDAWWSFLEFLTRVIGAMVGAAVSLYGMGESHEHKD